MPCIACNSLGHITIEYGSKEQYTYETENIECSQCEGTGVAVHCQDQKCFDANGNLKCICGYEKITGIVTDRVVRTMIHEPKLFCNAVYSYMNNKLKDDEKWLTLENNIKTYNKLLLLKSEMEKDIPQGYRDTTGVINRNNSDIKTESCDIDKVLKMYTYFSDLLKLISIPDNN